MKNLTHYFISHKEDETTNSKSSSVLFENNVNSDEPIQNVKKRKYNLSKSKQKKGENIVDISENEMKVENKNNKLNNTNKKGKKRKITEENICKEITANSKKIKLSKSKASNLKLAKSNSSAETQDKAINQINCNGSSEVTVSIDSNSNTCDEPLAKVKRKTNYKNLFLESDDDTTPSTTSDTSKHSPEITPEPAKTVNCARNSLLGYFNKVNKEIALKKEETPKIIKVEAQIHSHPTETDKPLRCSFTKRTKKSNFKSKHTSDNDFIDVLSSESSVSLKEGMSNDVDGLSKPESKEVLVDKIKEVNINKIPTNIASIFISKKVDKKDVYNKKNNSVLPEVDLKINKQNNDIKIDKKKKSLRIKKLSKKSEQKHEKAQESVPINNSINASSEKLNLKRNKLTKKNQTGINDDKNKFDNNSTNGLMTLKNSNDKPNVSETEETTENSEEVNVTINNASVYETPEKPKRHETPKQKSHKINGYFTPKNNINGICEIKDSEEKGYKDKKPAWVMKVRLSASRSHIGSDSDGESKDSIQEQQEVVSRTAESDIKSEDIEITGSKEREVCEVDGRVKSNKNYSRRKSLSRSAKSLKFTGEKSEPIKIPVVVIDDEGAANSGQEHTKKNTRMSSTKQPVKMWPFFQKGAARQAKETFVDQERQKAKIMFLESGVPEVLKKKVEIVKSESLIGCPAPFPTVSHVTQHDTITTTEATNPFLFPRQRCCVPSSPPVPVWSSLFPIVDSEEPDILTFKRPANVKASLGKMKSEEFKTEVKTVYKCLKDYKKKADCDIWTEIYKPNKSADIVGNSENIKKLKTWLETFKDRRKREGSVSSGDEFINDDSDGECTSINNLALISGPSGCGKTAAIYAIAAELDCKVLEINASCNRSGKRILAEFSESTQSHQVERSQKMNELFNHQMKGKSKKKKKYKKTNDVKSEKTSLILVEDADLLFTDADEGYMQALSSLAATAKRPIILVTNQTRNPHLDRFQSNRPLHLTFSKPKASKLELWLRLIGLVEGVEVTAEQAKSLVAWSGCDVRRALLQLQLMVQSNNSELKEKQSECYLWWQWPIHRGLHYELPTLLEAEDLNDEPPHMDKTQLLRELENISRTTSHLAYLDSFSTRCSHLLQMMDDQDDPCPTSWVVQCTDSTSQSQCLLGPIHSTTTELADWLAETVAGEGSKLDTPGRPGEHNAQEARWLSILRQSEEMFLGGVPLTMLSNHKAVACEYLPSLREIGRAEQTRLANYSRRANRFFNYLQGLGIHASKSYRDFMCDAFS